MSLNSPNHSEMRTTWEPLRVVLACRVTAGDREFVERVRADVTFDDPFVLAAVLACVLVDARCIVTASGSYTGPAILANVPSPRFHLLIGELRDCWLPQMPHLTASDPQQEWLSSLGMDGAKIFQCHEL